MSRKLWCCALVAAVSVSVVCRQSPAQVGGPPGALIDAKPAKLLELEARIQSALGEVTSLQFADQPLADVVTYVKERHNIAIQLDTTALESAGVASDTTVAIDVEGITLRSALNLMLKSIELTYTVRDGVLLITTEEEVDNHLVTEVYDARHFLYVADKHGVRNRDAEFLFDLICTHVQPTTWTDVGGTGAIELLDRSVVISQSWSTQQEVGQFMQAVEKAFGQHRQGAFKQTIEVGASASSSTQAVHRALAEETSLQFHEQPLSDVANYIKQRHKIELQLDSVALGEAGVIVDSSVEIDIEGVPLANALNLMLRGMGLTYSVSDEVLLISTSEEIENQLLTRIYPVKDLVDAEALASGNAVFGEQLALGVEAPTPGVPGASPDGPPSGGTGAGRNGRDGIPGPAAAEAKGAQGDAADPGAAGGGFPGCFPHPTGKPHTSAEQIVELIESTIEPTSWTDVGGTGSITYVPQFEGIVVSQTGDCHAQIDDLLARLRKVSLIQQATADDAEFDGGGEKLSLRPYHVSLPKGDRQPVKDVSAVSQLIQRVVEPLSWRQSDGRAFVQIVDDTLVIQATNDTHARIARLLEQLELTPGKTGGAPHGGGGGNSGGATAAAPQGGGDF